MTTMGVHDAITFQAVDGTVLNLHDPYGQGPRYAIWQAQDVGAPPLKIEPIQHGQRAGEILPSVQYEGRTFVLVVDVIATNPQELDDQYRRLARHLSISPGGDAVSYGILRHRANPSGEEPNVTWGSDRSIRCGVIRGLGIDQRSEAFGFTLRLNLVFYAEYPFWTEQAAKTKISRLYQYGGGVVPAEIAWTVSNNGKWAPLQIFPDYDGDAATWSLQWLIRGPAVNPTLYSTQTGNIVRLASSVSEGDIIRVRMGYQALAALSDRGDRYANPLSTSRFQPRTEFTVTDWSGRISHFGDLDPISVPIYILPLTSEAAPEAGLTRTGLAPLQYYSDYTAAEKAMGTSQLDASLASQYAQVEFHEEFLSW